MRRAIRIPEWETIGDADGLDAGQTRDPTHQLAFECDRFLCIRVHCEWRRDL